LLIGLAVVFAVILVVVGMTLAYRALKGKQGYKLLMMKAE